MLSYDENNLLDKSSDSKFDGGLSSYNYENKTAKFDLTLYVNYTNQQLLFSFEYNTRLFNKETINSFTHCFNLVIDQVINNSDVPILDTEILSDTDKRKITYEFNDTSKEYEQLTIVDLFLKQAKKNKDRLAIAIKDEMVTYSYLDEYSDCIVHLLQNKGIKRNSIVPVIFDRSIEMVASIYGVIKAGAAYLPINPSYPLERINYIINDSNSKLVLTQQNYNATNNTNGVEFYEIQREIIEYTKEKLLTNALPEQSPKGKAYVIYTSGSTGLPKGVVINHDSLTNRLKWMQELYPIGENDTILQKTPYTFDVSVWELFWWSTVGGSLCLLENKEEMDPA